jgi:hypothetical protein
MLFRKKEDVVSRREGDKTLVFHQNPGWVCILNSTSTFLWEHCTGELSVEDLVNLLTDRYEIPDTYAEPSDLRNLVTRHLELLQKADLLESTTA